VGTSPYIRKFAANERADRLGSRYPLYLLLHFAAQKDAAAIAGATTVSMNPSKNQNIE